MFYDACVLQGSINDNIAYPYQHCEEPLYNRSSEGGATVAEVVLGTHGSAIVRAGKWRLSQSVATVPE